MPRRDGGGGGGEAAMASRGASRGARAERAGEPSPRCGGGRSYRRGVHLFVCVDVMKHNFIITTRGSSARRGLSLSYFLLGVRLCKTRENNSGSFENISLNSRLNLDEAVDCSLIPAPWHTIVGERCQPWIGWASWLAWSTRRCAAPSAAPRSRRLARRAIGLRPDRRRQLA